MKVVLAVDDSVYSQEVINAVIDRQWPIDTEFKVLSVLEPLDCCLDDKFQDLFLDINEKRNKAANHLAKSVREKIEATIPGVKVHYEVRTGNPKSEVVDAAVEWCADRIMIGAHGHRGCPHNLIGSVSRAVATHAPCTVEIVRSKESSKTSSRKKKETTLSKS